MQALWVRSNNKMADRQGFEPWMGLHPCRFSRPVHSTALPSVRTRKETAVITLCKLIKATLSVKSFSASLSTMIEKIQSLLSENEKIIQIARIHPIVFAPSIVYCLLAFLVSAFFHPLVGGVILFLSLYPIYNAFISYWMTYLVLTDKKVLARVGFLSRDWTRMEFDKIENSYLEEPIIGRYLGYSTVILSGVGSGSIAIANVMNGDSFVKALEEKLTGLINKTPESVE